MIPGYRAFPCFNMVQFEGICIIHLPDLLFGNDFQKIYDFWLLNITPPAPGGGGGGVLKVTPPAPPVFRVKRRGHNISLGITICIITPVAYTFPNQR